MRAVELRVKSATTGNDLMALGYGPFFSESFQSLSRPDWAPARVLTSSGARVSIAGASSNVARLSGKLRHEALAHELPTVGDWVAVSDEPGGLATVHAVLPRRTQLVRRAAGERDQEQVVAANVDVFFLVTSANRDANARRLERYLAAVWDSGARPIVVLNKIDLMAPAQVSAEIDALGRVALGVPVAGVSAHTAEGVRELHELVAPGETFALIGSSGVGKSSLINRMLGDGAQAVLDVDENDRGRHTTTHRELFLLPDGRLAIDTPGMRSFGLIDSDDGLDHTFADIAALGRECRFRDCRHEDEPGCAVRGAIEAGELDGARLASAHKLEREIAAIERRKDPALMREHKSRWKEIHMAQRARKKVDPKLQR